MTLQVQNLLHKPGNDKCADCEHSDPRWVSCQFGVFLCKDCADIHSRLIETDELELITPDTPQWDEQRIQRLDALGNIKVNEEYEAFVPRSYRRPTAYDHKVLQEQWILSKYVRGEFRADAAAGVFEILGDPGSTARITSARYNPHALTFKEGFLWKRGKKKDRYQQRLFVLDGRQNTLSYYTASKRDSGPKNIYQLDNVNVVVTSKLQHPNGMQIVCDTADDKKKRFLFVFADSGKELVEWYSCIRYAKLQMLPDALRQRSPREVCVLLTHDFVKEGWLWKTGPSSTDAYRHRWFTLDLDTLIYSKQPQDAYQHCIAIGTRHRGYNVVVDVPDGFRRPRSGFAFTLVTPKRSYCLSAATYDDRREWMKWLLKVIASA